MFHDKVKEFKEKGYVFFDKYYQIKPSMLEDTDKICTDKSYKNGRRFLTHDLKKVPTSLRNLIVNEDLKEFFNLLEPNIPCRDIMLTHDYLNKFEINQYLHFDRWRSLKAMVYLSEVSEGNGAFSVVPGSHKKGSELRKAHNILPYNIRPNRIEIDFPEFNKTPVQIYGSAGTLILFDSDIFHCGGNIHKGRERKLIRSHWYYNRKWQEEV